MNWGKWLIGFVVAVSLVALALSWFFGVPYYYTLLGFLGWIVVGHLITIDDEEPGGWLNAEGSDKIWHSSLLELGAKAAVLLVAGLLLVFFPALHEFGAN
jgi:hypothetical protein